MAEILRHLLAKKDTILKLSLGVVLGLAGSVPVVQAQSPAQYTGNAQEASYGTNEQEESYETYDQEASAGTNVQQASYGRGRDCYPQYYQDCQPYTADNLGSGGEDDGDGQGGAAAPVVPFGEEDLYASNDTMANSPTSIAPNMIGDLHYGNYYFTGPGGTTSFPIAAGDRRFKIADNTNPLPQDRILFNFHSFDNAVYGGTGQYYDVNRYTFGIEKTFWDGMASFEVRAPFASGLTAVQTAGSASQGVEFGNMTGALKVLIFQTDTTIMSAGLAVTVPTARDGRVFDPGVPGTTYFDNEATFLQPFIGVSSMNADGLFYTFFGQMDFDVTGDGVTDTAGNSFQVYNQTLLMADLAIGKWVYRDPYANGFINGIAPVVELHYTTTTTGATYVPTANGEFGNLNRRSDVLNLVGGVHFLLGQSSMLTVTGGAPLKEDGDRYYDSEVGIRFNQFY